MRTYSQRYDGTIYFYGISAFRFVLRLERRGVGIINAEKNATAYFLRRVIPFFFCRGFFLSFSRITWKSGYIEFPCPFKCQLAGGRGFATFQLKWIPSEQTRKTNHSSILDTSLIISEASESLVYTVPFFFLSFDFNVASTGSLAIAMPRLFSISSCC